MNQKRLKAEHSIKMMWVCAALIVLVVIVAILSNATILVFIIPCMLMMGAMMWMMMGGRGGRQTGYGRLVLQPQVRRWPTLISFDGPGRRVGH